MSDLPSDKAPPQVPGGDIAALAKGGRTNFLGFLMRLAARLPFLFIGGRLYGASALGRFASALVIVELTAMEARPVLRAFSVKVPVGVAFAKRSGMVRDGTADEFEALAGRVAVFRFEPT